MVISGNLQISDVIHLFVLVQVSEIVPALPSLVNFVDNHYMGALLPLLSLLSLLCA